MSPLDAAVTVLQQLWRKRGPQYNDIDRTIAHWMLDGLTLEEVWLALGQEARCKGWGDVRELMLRRGYRY